MYHSSSACEPYLADSDDEEEDEAEAEDEENDKGKNEGKKTRKRLVTGCPGWMLQGSDGAEESEDEAKAKKRPRF